MVQNHTFTILVDELQQHRLPTLTFYDSNTRYPTKMISIDLREIPIFVLNLDKDHKRKTFMTEQLNHLGLEHQFIHAIQCDPSPIGVTLSHLKAISQKGLKPPFLVMEDDCKIIPHDFTYCFEVPQETDALYLGHALFGLRDNKDHYGIRWQQRGNVKYTHYDERYIRIFNMLALHAVIYISEKFVNSAIQANLSALLEHPFTIPGDLKYAEIQSEHVVLSVKKINFYQDKQYGGKENATKNSILSIIEAHKEVSP